MEVNEENEVFGLTLRVVPLKGSVQTRRVEQKVLRLLDRLRRNHFQDVERLASLSQFRVQAVPVGLPVLRGKATSLKATNVIQQG